MGADILQTAKASLQVLSAIVKAVPIPEPFKSAVVGIPDAVLQIITIIESAKGNMEDAKVLVLYIATITDRTIRPLDLSHLTPTTQNRIHEFQETLKQITEDITTLASQRPLRKWIINYDRDASTLSGLKQKVTDAIAGIQLETVIATGHEVELLYQEQQVLIRRQQEIEINQLIALLGTEDSGSSKKPPCMEGTRVSLLHWITRWIEKPSDDGKRGLCLIGAAGRGKSSVSASVAQQERRSKRLGADFYFTVDEQGRNEGVIPVLARQLASWGDRRLRNEIASALHADPDLAQRVLEEQFEGLILEPLETLRGDHGCPPLVMLLDGLDECNKDYATRLLHLIGQSFTKLPLAVKFIITSRPEPHLLHVYDRDPLNPLLVIRSLDLEDVGEVEGDIKEYFKQRLPQMVWGWVKNPSKWPGDERIEILVRLSNGLWIWAVTVCRMLADENFRDPENQLNALISTTHDPHGVYGHNTDLYAIYSKILDRACPPTSHDQLVVSFHDVLGALCVAKDPLNIHTLTSLLYLDHASSEDFIRHIRTRVLGYLQAVLIVPDVDEDDPSRDAKPIRFIHKSFKDYLTDESRCDARFLVNIAEEHRRMAIRCMRRMEDLQKPNICDIDPTTLNSDSSDEGDKRHQGLVQQHISLALQYACKHWATHVSGAPSGCDDVHASVNMFAKTRLLYWVEVLSLLEMTGGVIKLVKLVEKWLQVIPRQAGPISSESPSPTLPRRIAMVILEGLVNLQAGLHLPTSFVQASTGPLYLRVLDHASRPLANLPIQQSDTSFQASVPATESDISTLDLLQDLKNFVIEFEVPIKTSAPHIYLSALPFTPSHTALSRIYGHLAKGGPKPRRGCLQGWSQRSVFCLAWSPDGQRIISGCEDGTLCLWDASTGAPVGKTWKVDTVGVRCVAWSPDGNMIIAGSDDSTLQLLDSSTRARIGRAWKGHTNRVFSVAWSPDGKWVVSGSDDKTLRVWDPATGETVGGAWEGHTDWVWCVSWSPDGKRIASGSDDGTIRLWESSTGALVGKPWETKGTYGLAWSPDGKRIVSAHVDDTVRLWDAATGDLIGVPWEGHTRTVMSVAWSFDGKRIISGSADKTLRLWDASTGAPIGNAWQGHTDDVTRLGWSPDGKTIVSGSYDGTAMLWNSQTGDPIRLGWRGPNSHTRHVYHLAFAPNSNKIVTASTDSTLRLWDTSSGGLVGHPVCQTAAVASLKFSLNGKYVISENEECQTIWRIAADEIELADYTQVGPVSDVHPTVLKIDRDGWIRDPGGKRMFWLPVILRPIGNWGRILVHKSILVIEVPNVPIIDISAYVSRF
ncbi:hypothetical protein FRB94_014701 [Tulasnella sp. JGI-2019a]|nr:hypothetical protein FRB94_014701 [Tulasnella sp. JGI-2019a]